MSFISLLIFSVLALPLYFVPPSLCALKRRLKDQVQSLAPSSLCCYSFCAACSWIDSRNATWKTTCRIDISPQCWQLLAARCINRGYGTGGVNGAKGTKNIWSLVGICPPTSLSSFSMSHEWRTNPDSSGSLFRPCKSAQEWQIWGPRSPGSHCCRGYKSRRQLRH